jgi:hypothetical protein
VVYYDVAVSAIGTKLAVPCPQPAAAPDALKELVQRAVVETAARPRGIIKVVSKPANASLFIDGHEVGITPYKRPAFVGKHDIAVLGRDPAVRASAAHTLVHGRNHRSS